MGRVRRTIWSIVGVVVVLAGGTVALADAGTGQVAPPTNTGHLTMLPITADQNTDALPLTAPAAELINASTGQVLYAKNVLAKHYPASIVKLMTSLLALEMIQKGHATLNTIVPVSPAAYQVAKTPGLSVAYIDPTEQITMRTMLQYMYVVSADDAAVAVADFVGGTESAFAQLMNAKARELHMTGTHYTNASGLQDPNEYTNAHDIAILARYIIQKYPIVLQYASMKGMYIHPGNYGYTYDKLLGVYPGLDGLKTGSTDQAGYCFVGTAERNGTRLISVVLDTPSFTSVFSDNTAPLLDYGFSRFRSINLQKAGQATGDRVYVPNGSQAVLQVVPKTDVSVEIPIGSKTPVRTVLSTVSVKAPIEQGQRVAQENVVVNGHIVETVPVYALQADPKAGLLENVWRSVFSTLHHTAQKIVNAFGRRVNKYL